MAHARLAIALTYNTKATRTHIERAEASRGQGHMIQEDLWTLCTYYHVVAHSARWVQGCLPHKHCQIDLPGAPLQNRPGLMIICWILH